MAAAGASGRWDDVRTALLALRGDREPDWLPSLLTAVAVHLDLDPLAPGHDLGRLRLAAAVDRNGWAGLHLVDALVAHWDAEPDTALLAEADAVLGREAPEAVSRQPAWRERRAAVLSRLGRADEAYEEAAHVLDRPVGDWPVDIGTLLGLARAAGRVDELRAKVVAAQPVGAREERRRRGLLEQLAG